MKTQQIQTSPDCHKQGEAVAYLDCIHAAVPLKTADLSKNDPDLPTAVSIFEQLLFVQLNTVIMGTCMAPTCEQNEQVNKENII